MNIQRGLAWSFGRKSMFRYLVLLGFMLGLGATATLAQSDADVKLVQEKLIRYGVEKADGKMGNKTRNAIRAYQQDWQIPETGEITPDLIARLKREHPATKPQWLKIANQDCVVWNALPRPREEVSWTGVCTVSKASGTGKIVWSFVERGKSQQSGGLVLVDCGVGCRHRTGALILGEDSLFRHYRA